MKAIFYIVILINIISCSSINKSVIYGAGSGAVVGGIAGRALSPDRESDNFNTGIGVFTGALTGALISYLLYKEDPENRTLPTMINPNDSISTNKRINWEDLGVKVDSKFFKIAPDTSKLPDSVKDKVKKQVITEKTIPSSVLQGENGKSIYYPEQKVYEYDYEQ